MAKLILKKKVSKKSITSLMVELLSKDIECPFEKLLKEVKKLSPKSKFSKNCAAWYRSKVANKKLKGMK